MCHGCQVCLGHSQHSTGTGSSPTIHTTPPHPPSAPPLPHRSLCEQLALGPRSVASTSGRIATVQTLSGTGALRLGAEFLQQHHPVKVLYLPSPSWGNHEAMFREAHLEVRYYRYWHQSSKRLDEEVRGGGAGCLWPDSSAWYLLLAACCLLLVACCELCVA